MSSNLSKQIEAARLVEEANFDPRIELIANVSISALFYLQELANRIGLKIHEITPMHIIDDCAVQNRKHMDLQASLEQEYDLNLAKNALKEKGAISWTKAKKNLGLK